MLFDTILASIDKRTISKSFLELFDRRSWVRRLTCNLCSSSKCFFTVRLFLKAISLLCVTWPSGSESLFAVHLHKYLCETIIIGISVFEDNASILTIAFVRSCCSLFMENQHLWPLGIPLYVISSV